MPPRPVLPRPTRAPLRWLARLPVWLHRARLGWLMGGRILVLTHKGRKSGLPHHTPLEVVGHDEATDTYYVVSGWGEQADWLRNLARCPEVVVEVGGPTLDARAERLSPERAEVVLREYARRHPTALKYVARFMRLRLEGSESDLRRAAHELPVVALKQR